MTAKEWPCPNQGLTSVRRTVNDPPVKPSADRPADGIYFPVRRTVGAEHLPYGAFTARIPGSFVTRDWDVMYFVEVIATDGRGRNYPDLDRETLFMTLEDRGIQAGEANADVLAAAGLVGPDEVVVRFGLTADTTSEDVDRVLEVLPNAVERLKGMAERASVVRRTPPG